MLTENIFSLNHMNGWYLVFMSSYVVFPDKNTDLPPYYTAEYKIRDTQEAWSALSSPANMLTRQLRATCFNFSYPWRKAKFATFQAGPDQLIPASGRYLLLYIQIRVSKWSKITWIPKDVKIQYFSNLIVILGKRCYFKHISYVQSEPLEQKD